MTASRITLIVGWTAVIAMLGWSAYQHQVAREADEQRREVDATHHRVREETEASLAHAKRLNASVDRVVQQLAAPRGTGVQHVGRRPTPEEMQTAMRIRKRAMIELENQALCRRLHLSAADAKKLADIQEEFMERAQDVYAAAQANHLNPMSPELKPMMAKEEAELNRQIEQELGPEVAQAVADPQRTRAETAVGNVAADLCFSGCPLSLAQADALRTAVEAAPNLGMASFVTRMSTSTMMTSVDSTDTLDHFDELMSDAAALRQVMAAHLTPDQWALVENRMLTAELEFRTGTNGYATWRAIRKGQPAPTTFGLPKP